MEMLPYQDKTFACGRLISTVVIHILWRWHLYNESSPGPFKLYTTGLLQCHWRSYTTQLLRLIKKSLVFSYHFVPRKKDNNCRLFQIHQCVSLLQSKSLVTYVFFVSAFVTRETSFANGLCGYFWENSFCLIHDSNDYIRHEFWILHMSWQLDCRLLRR